MMFNRTVFALIMAATAVTNAGAVEDGAQFGDWRVKCEKAADEASVCHIFQRVTRNENGQLLLSLAVGYPRGENQPVVLFTLPLGIALSPGIALKVEDLEPQKMPFTACIREGCRAVLRLNNETITAMKKGNNATLTFATLDQKAHSVPISLKGFTKGFNSLKP